MKFFNTTGPCRPDQHYMLPPKERLVGAHLERYVKKQLYWALHAPRQTGKTTFLQSWMKELNSSGEAVACYVSVERCQAVPEAERAMPLAAQSLCDWAQRFSLVAPARSVSEPGNMLAVMLSEWAAMVAPKPLVILFDEVDVLEGPALVSFLRQLRDGFAGRGVGKFPVSIALVGMRDLKDYLVRAKDGTELNPGSPFNIKEQSTTLSNFTRQDIARLFAQRTQEMGQTLAEDALDLVFELTRGHPWLVNALFKKCTWELLPEESTTPITTELIYQAKEMLITERAVHIDSLSERLKDPRVKAIVEPILVGDIDPDLAKTDAFRLCSDLGLVALEGGTPSIANPIYREVLARDLSFSMQLGIPAPEFQWQRDDGTLDMDALLKEFQKFWRRHSDVWETKSDYTEAFPHLLVMAFLQRVINGGGRIEREYALGRGRVDLAILFGASWNIIEIKLVHEADGRKTTLQEGLVQIARYRKRIGEGTPSYLVLFDRTPAGRAKSWDERTSWEVCEADGGPVTVVGG